MEITRDLTLTNKQRNQIELHTFLNMLNILLGEFRSIRQLIDSPDGIPEAHSMTKWILAAVRDGKLGKEHALRLASLGFYFSREIHEARMEKPEFADNPALLERIDNAHSIIGILTVRLEEYFDRMDHGHEWARHPIAKLDNNFRRFFAAIEKNSRGRYQIMSNVAARGAGDYLVNLSFGVNGDQDLIMPPVMQDVLRDLIANARKYTPPGGVINAGLARDGSELKLVVEDNGQGIPEAEVDQVVEFGFRAGNARRQTQGGGFGLTKAYAVTRQFGGRMWIESELNRGTRVIIRIPIPANQR